MDSPGANLEDDQKRLIKEASRNLLKTSTVKNSFVKKLMKHLELEFELKDNCYDWLTRGLGGLQIRKGPKLATGYSGSKRINCMSLWNQIQSGKSADLDKMGFGLRLLKYSQEQEGFTIQKVQRKGRSDELSQEEFLHNHQFYIDDCTRKTLLEQLGKQDTLLQGRSEKDKKLLRNCSIYVIDCISPDSTQSFQLVFDSIRSILSFLVTAAAFSLI